MSGQRNSVRGKAFKRRGEKYPRYEDFNTPLHLQWKQDIRLRRQVPLKETSRGCLVLGTLFAESAPLIWRGRSMLFNNQDVTFFAMRDIRDGHFSGIQGNRDVTYVSSAQAEMVYGAPRLRFNQNLNQAVDYKMMPYDKCVIPNRPAKIVYDNQQHAFKPEPSAVTVPAILEDPAKPVVVAEPPPAPLPPSSFTVEETPEVIYPVGDVLDSAMRPREFELFNLMSVAATHYAYWGLNEDGRPARPSWVYEREHIRRAKPAALAERNLTPEDVKFLLAGRRPFQPPHPREFAPRPYLRFDVPAGQDLRDFISQMFWQATESQGRLDTLECPVCHYKHDLQSFGLHDQHTRSWEHSGLKLEKVELALTEQQVQSQDKSILLFVDMIGQILKDTGLEFIVDPDTRQKVAASTKRDVLIEQVERFDMSWVGDPDTVEICTELFADQWREVQRAFREGQPAEWLDSGGEFIAYTPQVIVDRDMCCGCVNPHSKDGRFVWHLSDVRPSRMRRRFTTAFKGAFCDAVAEGLPFTMPADCTFHSKLTIDLPAETNGMLEITRYTFKTRDGVKFHIELPGSLKIHLRPGQTMRSGQLLAKTVEPPQRWLDMKLDDRWSSLAECLGGSHWVPFAQQQWFANQAILHTVKSGDDVHTQVYMPFDLIAPAAKDLRPSGLYWDFSPAIEYMDRRRSMCVLPVLELSRWDRLRRRLPYELELDAGIYDIRFSPDRRERDDNNGAPRRGRRVNRPVAEVESIDMTPVDESLEAGSQPQRVTIPA